MPTKNIGTLKEMARDFNDTGNIAGPNNGIAGLSNTNKTMMTWLKQDTDSTDDLIMTTATTNTSGSRSTWQNLTPAVAGFLCQFSSAFTGTNGKWQTDNDLPLDTWTNVIMEYDGTNVTDNPIINIDGSSVAITETSTPTSTVRGGADSVTIGSFGAGVLPFDGEMYQAAIWDVDDLTAGEIAAVGKGVNPFVIRNEELRLLWPLYGNQSPEPNYADALDVGTVTVTTKSNSPNVELIENYL